MVQTSNIPIIVSTQPDPVIDEAIWRAWIQKGLLRDKASQSKLRAVVAALLIAGAAASLYLLKA